MGKRIETAEDMRAALLSNDKILCNSILALYACQEADEQQSSATRHKNGMGFNGTDAYILSSFAQQIRNSKQAEKEGTFKYATWLSPKQLDLARKKMPKYANQLLGLIAPPPPAEEPAAAKVATYPVSAATGARLFCCDCGQPADVMAWETSLCNGCQNTRDMGEVARNRLANDRQQAMADNAERMIGHAHDRRNRSTCDCGQEAEQEFNGRPCCSDCSNQAEVKEQGRQYREFRRLVTEEEEAAKAEGRPSLVVREGNSLRFMTAKEQHAAGYRLDLKTGRPWTPVKLQPSLLDPFDAIPAVYSVK
jgi:hypothetical protein